MDTLHNQTCPCERQLLTVLIELDGKLEETKDGSQVRTLWSGGTMKNERCRDITMKRQPSEREKTFANDTGHWRFKKLSVWSK